LKKNKISKNWINKQRRDIYVRKSKIEGYRSRAIYKLKEIDEKFKILKNVVTAIDLGAAPGSWSQYLSQKINHGKILAIDILEFQTINKVHQLIGDFTNENTKEKIREYFNKKVDLILMEIIVASNYKNQWDFKSYTDFFDKYDYSLYGIYNLSYGPNKNLLQFDSLFQANKENLK